MFNQRTIFSTVWIAATLVVCSQAFGGGGKRTEQQKFKVGEFPTPKDESPAVGGVHPAQLPIERSPGFSASPVVLGKDSKGNFGITSIDRNHPTVKQWIKEQVISEAQISRIESGTAVDIKLPDAHE